MNLFSQNGILCIAVTRYEGCIQQIRIKDVYSDDTPNDG